jgi:predicted HNH restriction endonuclease
MKYLSLIILILIVLLFNTNFIKSLLKSTNNDILINLPENLAYYTNTEFLLRKPKYEYVKNQMNQMNQTNKKRNVTEKTKKIIASNQHWKCFHCKSILDYTYEIDHIVPLCKGGTNDINNLQALCRNCHGKKTYNDLNF